MDHVVYLDVQAKELENLLAGKKTMIIRGATGRKLPHGRVDKGDMLYFINNNAEGMARAFSSRRPNNRNMIYMRVPKTSFTRWYLRPRLRSTRMPAAR